MQKFTLHSHTNSYGIFDGRNSIEEMIKAAEDKGFTEYGISNHIICHPHKVSKHPMYFSHFQECSDIYKKLIDDIREAGSKSKIKVYVGFEVDYFHTKTWRNDFENLLKQIKFDYLIGSNHSLFNDDLSIPYSLYHIRDNKSDLPQNLHLPYSHNYWRNEIEMIKSGYFDFAAHFDLIKTAGVPEDATTQELKQETIETLAKYNMPFEINTSAYDVYGEQCPSKELLIELNKRNVPTLISDDSHWTDAIGQHYDKAEALLAEVGYKNRWSIKNK